jgi:hypothetical protein
LKLGEDCPKYPENETTGWGAPKNKTKKKKKKKKKNKKFFFFFFFLIAGQFNYLI